MATPNLLGIHHISEVKPVSMCAYTQGSIQVILTSYYPSTWLGRVKENLFSPFHVENLFDLNMPNVLVINRNNNLGNVPL